MFDFRGFFSQEEAKAGLGVAAGIYATEFASALLRGFLPQSTGNQWTEFLMSALLKGLVGALLYNFGRENTFLRYMAIGAWASIMLDLFRMILPSAQSVAASITGRAVPFGQSMSQEIGVKVGT